MEIYNLINNNLIEHVKTNTSEKPIFFIFGIGTYPARYNSNHEHTKLYMDLKSKNKYNLYRILIDPEYEKLTKQQKDNYDENTIIKSVSISHREYYSIVDFCNFASHFNCLSVVMEFTGYPRNQIYNISNKVYITPSECLTDTNFILYNPVIINDEFYKITESTNSLYIELETQYDETLDYVNIQLIEYIRIHIIINFLKINYIYRKILNYMKLKEEFEMCFIKEKPNFKKSLEKITYRMGGYYEHATNVLIENFINSSEVSFEIYIKDIIRNTFIDCFYLKNNGIVNNNISFENDTQLKELYDNYYDIFKEEINRNNLTIFFN